MKGRNEAWTAREKDGREEVSGGGIERGREGAMREGEQGREENFNLTREVSRGRHMQVYNIFTNHSTKRPLALTLLYYK